MQDRKTILITGASSGIGEATALHLAAQGHNIVLGARRIQRLNAILEKIGATSATAMSKALDVTDLDDFKCFADAACERFGRIDVLVNNAGVMPLSMMQDLRVEEWNRMIDVNLRGVLHGIAVALPVMNRQGSGHIINIASTSAHRVDPSAAVYCATKFAVRALSEGLRQENKKVRVTVISPGLTQSELVEGIEDAAIKAHVRGMMEAAIPASSIANAIGYAIGQPDDVDVNEIIVRPTAQG
ncbi:SDR family oxidoreductase [Rhizobium leguminosarum]|uniref:SDR family oxidoreductase n=1 Tax=Rhizobium leguminosarum TaxID=384 RepID=UPI001FDF1659|nr:SDR family oxidoreductase [Rhizobium leguminosarum]